MLIGFCQQIVPLALPREKIDVAHFHQEHKKLKIYVFPKTNISSSQIDDYQSIFKNAQKCVGFCQKPSLKNHEF